MSASDPDSTIYLSDTDNQIKKKIGKAFSGGQDTRELHEKLGGRTAVDVPFQYLTFFLDDDELLEEIKQAYEKGVMQSGEMKATATKELQAYVAAFRKRRTTVTPQVRAEFMRPRQLVFRGMPPVKDRMKALQEKKMALQRVLDRANEEISQLQSNEDVQ